MTALDLLADLGRLGVELGAEGDRLHFQAPRGVMTEELRQRVADRKAELLQLPRCPGCKRFLDHKGRCWRCNHRACSRCGLNTGTAFIELCLTCEAALRD
jgi:hypothetical protein